MKSRFLYLEICIGLLALLGLAGCSRPPEKHPTALDLNAATSYLDNRESWWMQWVGSSRDHGTFCVSCHTALPYALSRPALRAANGDATLSPGEQALIGDVTKRVKLWNETKPYYSEEGYDQKSAESRGTESVLNALILANYDAAQGKLSPDARAAFDHMWSIQQTEGDGKGSWSWLQFDQEPWEAKDSVYYGACLAAIATGIAPDSYSTTPEIQHNVAILRGYLHDHAASQSTINRVYLLWASTKLPNLLTREKQNAIIQEALNRQQEDGGWRLASITWSWRGWSAKTLLKMWLREEGTPLHGNSDGVATGLVVYVLEESGVTTENRQLQRGLSWLKKSQTQEGDWPASSVNKVRHVSAYTSLFMNDAATAFAVLALEEQQQKTRPVKSASNRQPQ